jgi:hypothetical protein
VSVFLGRGIAAGLLAGLLAGLVGLVVGEPALQRAIDLEPAAATASPLFSRDQQRAGLVVGSGLMGIGVGAVFGVSGAWAVGRIRGDAWVRSLKLGGAAVVAMVLLPIVKYPAAPPGVGDPQTVGLRTTLFLGVGVLGLLLALIGWAAARQLAATGLSRPARSTLVGAGLLLAATAVLFAAPSLPVTVPDRVPAPLLWSFRLGSLATQVTLYGGTAVVFGLLSRERSVPAT